VPLVSAVERTAYEQFYGFNITQQRNRTGPAVIRAPNTPGRVFGPFTLFVPPLAPPPATNPDLYGFDLLSLATAPVNFRNVSKYLVVPATLVSRTQNNYGFVAVARNKYGKGYMFGRVGSQQLLEFSLMVPRKDVTLAAYVLSSNASRQALFYDDTPLLANATNVTIFDTLPGRALFYTANFTAFGETIMVAVRYSDAFAATFAGNTWVILAAVLAPVCFLVDVIFVVLALLWQRRRKLLKLEERKRKDAQVMISYVNHEIRNPLQTILGLADMELEEAQDANNCRLADNLEAIVGAAEFIEHIATDILDLRRVEEGKVDIEMSDVDVETLVKSLERSVQPLLAKKHGVAFKVILDQEIRTIHTDRYRLEQILMNFLTNAFKHTEEGLITLSVSFATISWIRFSVWDTGKGIPPDKTASLFQQFAQVSSKDSSDLGGFGLGLYLTKMLAELLGGHVGFESTFGLGSVFWVDLPVEWDSKSLSFQFQKSETRLHHPVGLNLCNLNQ
jgi:signal transduction histidine kinase